MPRDMFGDVVDPSIKMGNKMWYTVPLTMLIQAAVVASLIIVPLMATGMLPAPPSMMAFVATPPPPPPPPVGPQRPSQVALLLPPPPPAVPHLPPLMWTRCSVRWRRKILKNSTGKSPSSI